MKVLEIDVLSEYPSHFLPRLKLGLASIDKAICITLPGFLTVLV